MPSTSGLGSNPSRARSVRVRRYSLASTFTPVGSPFCGHGPRTLVATMTSKTQSLGVCPECSAEIPSGAVLVEYERDGGPVVYAECPDCVEPVHPR